MACNEMACNEMACNENYINMAYQPLTTQNDIQRVVSKKKILYITGKRVIGNKIYTITKKIKYI
jgi:hypothetical protein